VENSFDRPVTLPELSAMVEALKEAYRILRTQWCGPFSFRLKDEHLWTRAANLLIRGKGDPFVLVKYIFDKFLLNRGEIYVNMVTSPKLIEEFIKQRPKQIEELELRAKLQAMKVESLLKRNRGMEEIIIDDTNELSPVFCYILAKAYKLDELAELLKRQAKQTLIFESEYYRIYRELLPEELQ